MKKFSLITVLVTCILLFFSNIPTSYAEEVHSKVTGTLIQSDEVIDTTKPDESDSNEIKQPKANCKKKDHSKGNLFSKLPQAGDTINWKMPLVGILLVVISLIVILVKRRRNSNEKK